PAQVFVLVGGLLAVAILTRRERRVQPAIVSNHTDATDAVAILTRRERRVQPWIGWVIGHSERGLRSSPDANVGCSRASPRRKHLHVGVAILTRRERRVQQRVYRPGV